MARITLQKQKALTVLEENQDPVSQFQAKEAKDWRAWWGRE